MKMSEAFGLPVVYTEDGYIYDNEDCHIASDVDPLNSMEVCQALNNHDKLVEALKSIAENDGYICSSETAKLALKELDQ